MVPREDPRRTEQMNHQDDHIRRSDETFKYQGELPIELAQRFFDEKLPKITLLQGFIASGKTRTSKEFVRLLARDLREQEGGQKEVHTFLFDLRNKSVESLLMDICREFKDKLQGWERHGNVENVAELSAAFGRERDNGRIFLIILKKVDGASDRERPEILENVQNLVANTDNVYVVLTSRTDVTFVKDNTVMKHRMKCMERNDAKALLKETSGNPKSFDEYADKIIDLVGGSPLALMIAGHEMNGRNTQLPYTPKEFVGVMTDSTSLSLHLENAPAEDRIISRVADIVKANFHVLEKIVVALDCPQLFDTENLETSMAALTGPSSYEGQIKQTILHVVLRRSLYGLNGESDLGVTFESSPLLIEVLKETFCQLVSKDGFLKEFNKNLVKTLGDDTSHLMRSGAKELRQAEIHLLRNQKGPKVTLQDVQKLRMNVIGKAAVFLDTLEVNAMTHREFQTCSLQILNEWKMAEAAKGTVHVGIQETRSDQRVQPVICCGNLPRMSPETKEKELEACVSPTTCGDIVLPGLKDTNQAGSTAKTATTEAGKKSMSAEVKGAVGTNLQKEDNGHLKHRGSEKKIANGVVSSSMGSTNVQEQAVIPNLTFMGKNAGTEVISKADVNVNNDENLTSVSQSHVTSNVFTKETDIDLCKSFNKSVSLDSGPFGSLHSNDCREPIQETHATYSMLTTLPVSQILTSASNVENRKAEMSPKEVSSKEAVESEFNWEHGDNDEVGESSEVANVDKKPVGVVTQAEGKNDHLGDKTKHGVKKPHLHPEVEKNNTPTTTTPAIITSTSKIQTSQPPHLQLSHPMDWKNKTRGSGILGSAPSSSTTSSSTSSSFHFPANAQVLRLPSHNNPMPDQNTSFIPLDRGCLSNRGYGVYGDPHIQQQGQMMIPHPIQPQPVQGGTHNPPYSGDSFPYNQFEREYNEAHYQGSHYTCSNGALTHQFSKNSDKFSQACGPPTHSNISMPAASFGPRGQSYRYPQACRLPLQNQDSTPPPSFSQACALPLQSNGSSPSPRFRPRGPSYRHPHTHRHPHQSHVSNPPVRLQATPNRFPQACGPPLQTCDSSPSPSFCPQGPSCRFPQAYGPSHQNYVSTPQPGCEMHSFSGTYSQCHGPPLQSNGSSPSSSFHPQGPPSWNVLSPPQSLRTNGFYVPPGSRNGPPSHFNQRNYGHHQYQQNR